MFRSEDFWDGFKDGYVMGTVIAIFIAGIYLIIWSVR